MMIRAFAIPAFACLPGCTACCRESPVPFSGRDKAAMSKRKPWLDWEQVGQDAWIMPRHEATGRCPFVGPAGCTLHGTEDYPMICRLYGSVETLPCKMGCGPERKLSDAEARAMIEDARI